MSRADDLVHTVAHEVARGSDYAARPWHTIVVVADLDGRRRLFGYCFWDDDWEAATPDGFDALLGLVELREATRTPSGEAWRGALMRLRRPDPHATDGVTVEIEFDHDGGRWRPDPADPAGFALSLRDGGGS